MANILFRGSFEQSDNADISSRTCAQHSVKRTSPSPCSITPVCHQTSNSLHVPLTLDLKKQLTRFDEVCHYAFQVVALFKLSSSDSFKSYSKLLLDILSNFPKVSFDRVVFNTRVNVFLSGEITLNFHDVLSEEEQRLLSDGRFKTVSGSFKQITYESDVFLGKGSFGIVYKTLNLSSCVLVLKKMQYFYPDPNFDCIKPLKEMFKEGVRASLVALKWYKNGHVLFTRPLLDALQVLKSSPYCLLPFGVSKNMHLLGLGVSSLFSIFCSRSSSDLLHDDIQYEPLYRLNKVLSKLLPRDRLKGFQMIVRSAAVGLKDIHSLGVIHRDLKPANMVITKDGVKFIDFDLAVIAKNLCEKLKSIQDYSSDFFIGTPDFIAPEHITASAYGEADKKVFLSLLDENWWIKTDLYAFGISLCWMLLDDSIGEKVQPYHNGDTCSRDIEGYQSRVLQSKLPPSQKNILSSLISRNPDKRPSIDAIIETFS